MAFLFFQWQFQWQTTVSSIPPKLTNTNVKVAKAILPEQAT